MKRIIIRSILAVAMTSAFLLQSCGKMEPSTYTETFFRIATVQYNDGKASLLMDYSGETYFFTNFSTSADMEQFDVKSGDRVIASMTLSAIGYMTYNQLTLNEIYKFPILPLAESRPSDTIYNYRYQLKEYALNLNSYDTRITYPTAWAQGHLVNMTPKYEISSDKVSAQFYLYPIEVKNKTLVMRLYSNIPDTLPAYYYDQSLVCYDLSTLRNTVADSIEQAHRDSILYQLESLNMDTIDVQICEPEIMRDIWLTTDGIEERKYYNPRASATVKVPFDF